MRTITSGLLASLLIVCSLPSKAIEGEFNQKVQDLCDRPLKIYGSLKLGHQNGFTTQKYPTLYFSWYPVSLPCTVVRFTLIDARSLRPVAAVPVQLLEHASLQRIPLRDYGIELEPYAQYQWYVSEIWDSALLSETWKADSPIPSEVINIPLQIAEGVIIRIDPKHQNYKVRPCDGDHVRTLAHARIWYDAFSCVIELIEASPDDLMLRDLKDELLGKCRAPYDRMPVLGACQ